MRHLVLCAVVTLGVATSATLLSATESEGPPRLPDDGGQESSSTQNDVASEEVDVGPRLSEWVERRRAKFGHLSAYKPGFLERQLLKVEKAERPPLTEFNVFGFYPRIQTIDHRSQTAFGTRFWQPDIGGSRFDATGAAFWSLGGFWYFDVQLGMVPHHGRAFPFFTTRTDDVFELAGVPRAADQPYALYGVFNHRWAPKFDFFGVGPDSRRADRSDFRQRDTLYEMVGGWRLLPPLTVMARAGYYEAAIGSGDDESLPNVETVFDPADAPGLSTGRLEFIRFGASAIIDTRDVLKNPHRGAVVSTAWTRYDQRESSSYTFTRYGLDARAFVPLGHRQRVLAVRAYFSRDSSEGAGVPFYLMSFLGSSHTLRAYTSQRFRGEKMILLQAEYRWEAAPALELAAFVDTAKVAARASDAFGDFKTDAGIGLRFKSHEATLLRLDFAWGEERFRFLFRFSPSF